MVTSQANTPEEYIAELPPDRRDSISRVREVVRQNLPAGYEEGMQYGMIGWYIPFSRLPKTYNGQPLGYAALASQKTYMSLYLNNVYGDPEIEAWFRERFAASGHPLDMGKSCVHFRRAEDLPLDLIGETIARTPLETYVARYQALRGK
jgi:hypothetical protein